MGQILHNNSPFLLCFRKIIIFRKVDMRYIFHLCFWGFFNSVAEYVVRRDLSLIKTSQKLTCFLYYFE